MNDQSKYFFGFLLLFVAGCNSNPDAKLKNQLENSESNVLEIAQQLERAKDHNDDLTTKIESLNEEIERLKSSAAVLESVNDPIAHLFSTTWRANALATKNYSGNAKFDAGEIDRFAWSHGTNQKTEIFFKDAGAQLSTNDGKSVLVPVDYKSETFDSKFKLIDRYHFAFFDGKYWLVFRNIKWESENYSFEK